MKKLIIAAAVGLTLAASMHVSANTGIEAGIGTKESYIDAQVLPKTSIGYSRLDAMNTAIRMIFMSTTNCWETISSCVPAGVMIWMVRTIPSMAVLWLRLTVSWDSNLT